MTKSEFLKRFRVEKPVIGMVHIDPLPGTPLYKGSMTSIIDKAVKEAEIYINGGTDAIAIENMHDIPYINNNAGPEITASMSVIAHELRKMTDLPLGIQILAGANMEAMAVAGAADLDFIRCEGFVFGHVADEGYMDSCAGKLLRYRKMIDGEDIMVFTDIKKKHSSHAVTADVDILETAKAAQFFLSDGLIITGESTGTTADLRELKDVSGNLDIPVLVGSGVTIDNIEDYMAVSDGLIIGSWFKKDGHWASELDGKRVKDLMDKVKNLRKD